MTGGKRIFKGNFIFTKNKDSFSCLENHYILTDNGKIAGVYPQLKPEHENIPIEEFDGLIIPGFVDLHLHAPQYENMGLGMDEELLPWLEKYTFPEEARFEDAEYAKDVYGRFALDLRENGITRCAVFGTIHNEATDILFEVLEKTGIGAYVGKVCMDRGSSPELTESTLQSLDGAEEAISSHLPKRGGNVLPIITPRFAISCSSELMEGLGRLAAKYGVPVQSHLSENRKEIEMVAELYPGDCSYAEVYDNRGLFGQTPTIMAHCVHCGEKEMSLIKKRGVFVAHCPVSNSNVASGIAPIKEFLSMGAHVGLGTDISGGHSLWMPDVIVHALQLSKIKAAGLAEGNSSKKSAENVMQDALSLSETFYMATKGGGAFFGNVGSFEKDFDFDALFIDDSLLAGKTPRTLEERLSRFIYRGSGRCVVRRFAAGKEI